MNKFVYVSSADELKWIISEDADVHSVDMKSNELDDGDNTRFQIATWINTHCRQTVYGWNRCETPRYGETDWGRKVATDGSISLIFQNNDDKTLFVMTWK